MENKISINLRRFVTILIAVFFTEHISAQDNIVVPQIQPSVQAPSPISIKIAAEISGKRVYYSTKEWKNMPVEEKIKINTLGVIVSQGNERFMFALNPLSYKRVDRKTAQVISGNQMPTKKQWQIILQNEDKILRTVNKPGTIGLYGDWWCSDTKSYMASVMYRTANRLVSANYDDEAGVWLATDDIDGGFKEITIVKPDGENYDYVGDDCNWPNNYYRLVRYQNKYGFIDKTGAVVIPLKYDDVYCGMHKDESDYWTLNSCVSVCQSGKWGYINSKGEIILPLMYDKVERRTKENGWTRVMKEKLVGAINNQGTFLIPIMYDELESNYNKNVVFAKKNGKYGFIDQSNNIVIPFKYDFTSGFSDGLAVVGIAGKYGYINEKGEEIIPSIYEFAEPFHGGLAAVAKNGKLGYINREGKTIIPFKYQTSYVKCLYDYYGLNVADRVSLHGSFDYKYAAVKTDNEKWGLINKKGDLLTEFKYDRIISQGTDGVTAICNNKEVYIDIAGNEYQTEEERKEKSTEKMAKQGYADAQYRLGCRYLKEKNYELGHEWLLKAVEQGNVDAITAIARDYNARKEYKLAYDWYVKAFNCGVVESLIEIGDLFYYKEGLELSYAKATDWYLKYIEYPEQSAYNKSGCFYKLGYMYYYGGYGIQASYTKALDYFKKSDAYKAKYFLGWMYEHGQGTGIDINQAIQWYEKSDSYKDSKERIVKLKDRQHTTSGIINGHEWVDLGLSVKWATCNVGANKSTEVGHYFSWGEIGIKPSYTEKSITAAAKKIKYDIMGNQLYDAATAQWGSTWRLPTDNELRELAEKCQWTETMQDGNSCLKVTGPNGNYIFIPLGGYVIGNHKFHSERCYLWSSSRYYKNKKDAYRLRYDRSGSAYVYHMARCIGLNVRPVSK